jgi:hypothetical protein
MKNETASVYFSPEDKPIFDEIKAIAEKEKRGVGFIIARIFREWRELKNES